MTMIGMRDEGGGRREKRASASAGIRSVLIPHPSSLIPLAAAVFLAAALSGCGTPAKTPPRPGGYYLDDGPGAKPPANLDSIPDATPRAEPINRGTSRPYVVMGRSYSPMTSHQPYQARGIATWYGRRYHGKPTASGEPYDMYAMTAAHTTLPIPSYARVTNLKNGRSVVVRVNDRGPFVDGRIIDLSYTAAHRIGVLGGGSAMVEVVAILPGNYGAPLAAPAQPAAAAPLPESPPPVAARDPGPPAPLAASPIPVAAEAGGHYLQLGAFGSRENAENFLTRMKAQMDGLADNLHVYSRDGLYRVHAGPYASQPEARHAAERINQTFGVRTMVLTR